ncbi:MAG: alpha/beta hydrolase [Anaerolineae bacterium]|nr:alpha/beta hydrolase [Anaerolineae bacterium]
MPIIEVENQTMHYQVVGEGTPTLLMHGWVMVGDDMLPLANQIAALGRRVIVPDLPGYGQSVPPFRGFPPDFYFRDAAMMTRFLDALDVQQVDIMGFSDGGEVALLLPIMRADLCRSVIAWGAIGSFPPDLCEPQRRALPHKWITDFHRSQHPGQNIDLWPYQWVDAFCAVIEQHGGDVSLSRAHMIKCPTLLILGDQDGLNPAAYGQKFVDRIPNKRGKMEVFPGVGHSVHTEQPLGFLETIKSFWGRNGY